MSLRMLDPMYVSSANLYNRLLAPIVFRSDAVIANDVGPNPER